MPAEPLRIGFVGAGQMGQAAHLRQYAGLPDCRVVALAELRPDLAARVAARYGVERVYHDHRAMLAAERLDGLVAAQPFTRHGVLLPELLTAGVPVFIEKPLAASVEVGRALVQAVADSGTWVMVGYHKRSDPATVRAVAEIAALKASGALGKLTYVRVTMPPGDWIAGGFDDLIRSAEPLPELTFDPPPADLSDEGRREYAAFVNYYIHQVNLLRHLPGEPYQVTWAEPSGVLLIGRSASGVPCCLEMAPYRTTSDWQESALICFERGWLRLALPAPVALNRPGRLTIFRDPGNGTLPETIEPQLPWVSAMRQQAVNFLAAIRGQAPPPCEAAEALEDLLVARDYLRLRSTGVRP